MIEKSKSNLTSSVSTELLDPTIDIAIDYGELALDSELSGKLFEEIPIFKTIYSGTKIFGAIRGHYTARNILTFPNIADRLHGNSLICSN